MYQIVEKNELSSGVWQLIVKVSQVARKRKPGQFVVLRIDEKGERFPLTIVDSDIEAGTVELIVQAAGYSTTKLVEKNVGDYILDILGPLGKATEIDKFGKVACLAGGVGAALLFPIAAALKEAGNEVFTFLGAQTAETLILKDRLARVSDSLIVTTDDGSEGIKGFGSDVLKEKLEAGAEYDRVFAIGPLLMMRAAAEVTRPFGIETIVSLNPIMVDGTGMCGGCRVTVDGDVKFACVEGPEFDAHSIDFEELLNRQNFYHEEEECKLKNKKMEREK